MKSLWGTLHSARKWKKEDIQLQKKIVERGTLDRFSPTPTHNYCSKQGQFSAGCSGPSSVEALNIPQAWRCLNFSGLLFHVFDHPRGGK